MRAARGLAALAAAFALAASAAPARAASPDARGPAFRLSRDVDASALLLSGSIAAGFFFMSEHEPPACAPLCDRSRVNRLDRWAAGLYSPAWGTAGDVGTASVLAFAPVALVLSEGVKNGLNDSVVVVEAALATSALQVSVSYAAGRPRPRVYGEEAPVSERDDANAGRSFFSGHVANSVAATVAAAYALEKTGRVGLARAVLATGLAGSAFVGVARVGAGSHFPTDVAVGAAVGASLGLLMPALHGSGVSALPVAEPGRVGLALAGAF